MNKWIMAIAVTFLTQSSQADDTLSEPEPEREPASLAPALSVKRNYPGGGDEEDLRVQSNLPEATQQTDARSVQREVFKNLYNKDLKDDRQDAVEE